MTQALHCRLTVEGKYYYNVSFEVSVPCLHSPPSVTSSRMQTHVLINEDHVDLKLVTLVIMEITLLKRRYTLSVLAIPLRRMDVTPLLTHWSYVFLALTHRYDLHEPWLQHPLHTDCSSGWVIQHGIHCGEWWIGRHTSKTKTQLMLDLIYFHFIFFQLP